jgi:hypothetical protein
VCAKATQHTVVEQAAFVEASFVEAGFVEALGLHEVGRRR